MNPETLPSLAPPRTSPRSLRRIPLDPLCLPHLTLPTLPTIDLTTSEKWTLYGTITTTKPPPLVNLTILAGTLKTHSFKVITRVEVLELTILRINIPKVLELLL